MSKYNYIKAPVSVAERAGLAGMRKSAGEGFVILSEGDLRMIDLTQEEKMTFFGCEEVTEEQAKRLIIEGSNVEETETIVSESDDFDAQKEMEDQDDE